MGAAQAGMTVIGQQQAAKTQAEVQRRASAAERQRYLHEVSSMRIQQGQEQVAAAQRLSESARKATEARATARVSAGEAGVAGLSVDALINDLTRQEAEYSFNVQKQTQMSDVNRQLQLRDAGLGFTTICFVSINLSNNLTTLELPLAVLKLAYQPTLPSKTNG